MASQATLSFQEKVDKKDEEKIRFVTILRSVIGEVETVTRPQIIDLVKNHQAPDPIWLWNTKDHRLGAGVYTIPSQLYRMADRQQVNAKVTLEGASFHEFEDIKFDEQYVAQVPDIDPLYEPFGHYKDIEKITLSGQFFPYWVAGLSGNGKTTSIEQAHARNKKPLVFIPVTKEADKNALLGGLRLRDGNTVPFYGPVTQAAILGCTALLDETDMGDEKLMCLQNALQNRPYLIKRLGKMIHPKLGFNIVATANTKGRGSDDGRFMGANIMNDSSLERYICMFEQDYPSKEVERKILRKILNSLTSKPNAATAGKDDQFIERLILWAEKIRKTYNDKGISEVITTRRLVHICKAYHMFGRDRKKAIALCTARFDADVRVSFTQYYELIDADQKKADKEMEQAKKLEERGLDPETPFG